VEATERGLAVRIVESGGVRVRLGLGRYLDGVLCQIGVILESLEQLLVGATEVARLRRALHSFASESAQTPTVLTEEVIKAFAQGEIWVTRSTSLACVKVAKQILVYIDRAV